jgi:hypothetical protein
MQKPLYFKYTSKNSNKYKHFIDYFIEEPKIVLSTPKKTIRPTQEPKETIQEMINTTSYKREFSSNTAEEIEEVWRTNRLLIDSKQKTQETAL